MKRTHCSCGKDLTGRRTRYCSDTCYMMQKLAREKRVRKLYPALPQRNCIVCKILFWPKRTDHTCCCTNCRKTATKEQAQEKRKRRAVNPCKWTFNGYSGNTQVSEKTYHTSPNLGSSPNKKEILKYLSEGGRVTRLPDQQNGRTPSIAIPHVSGWSPDTLMGLGYEMQLMDEIHNVDRKQCNKIN